RKSIEPYLPSEIVNRKDKLGYPVPFAKWTREKLKNYITDTLLKTNSDLTDFIDEKYMKLNLEMHFAGKIDYIRDIWRLLSLDKLWIRSNSIPVTNLENVYNIPLQYDNDTKINIKVITADKIVIEGNKRLKQISENKAYDYYDTVSIKYPAESSSNVNKIFLSF